MAPSERTSAESFEESAGCALLWNGAALLIRLRKQDLELPKGHLEPGESPFEAAIRELREETGLESEVVLLAPLDTVEYAFESGGQRIHKRVHYFAVASPDTPCFGPLPRRTRELCWVTAQELPNLPLVNEDLRGILAAALSLATPSKP